MVLSFFCFVFKDRRNCERLCGCGFEYDQAAGLWIARLDVTKIDKWQLSE